MEATELYEKTRTKIAEFINAKDQEEIIFYKKCHRKFKFNCIFIWNGKLKKR